MSVVEAAPAAVLTCSLHRDGRCVVSPETAKYQYMRGRDPAAPFVLAVCVRREGETWSHNAFDLAFATEEARDAARRERLPGVPELLPVYVLEEWEHNGPDDSDFMAVVFDPNDRKLSTVQLGTTRYGGCSRCGGQVCYCGTHGPKGRVPFPDEYREVARLQLKESVRRTIELHDRGEIDAWYSGWRERWSEVAGLAGTKMRLVVPHKFQEKRQERHAKCGGTGKWTNPKKPADVRVCFGCGGTGEVTSREKLKTLEGKPVWKTVPVGEVVEFVELSVFGYSSVTAKVRLADGRTVRVPPDKLRLDREPLPAEEVERRAEEYSRTAPWSFVSGRHVVGARR